MLLAFLTLACTGPTTTDSPTGATPTDSEVPRPALPDEVRTLPRTAPAVALMAVLDSEDGVTVEGTVSGPLTVDVDDAEDDRDAFRYAVLDDTGRRLYERTRTSPVIVRDFLDHYGAEAGFDILALLPQLGRFPLQVPLLDEGVEVVFELRQPDGTYAEAGRYALDAIDADDLGLSDQVTGWETLHESGPSEHRLDVVLLGDGYTADQRDEWHSDAADFAAHLLGAQPFADHADRLNLHRVDATSPESGASWDCQGACKTRDTAFDSIFPLQFVNEVLGTSYSVGSILQEDQFEVARAASNVPWDLAVVIVNTNESGGFAVHYASVSADSRWLDTGVHEFGHLMGQLGDEYISDPCIIGESLGLPVNIADDLDALPWAVWIDPDTPLPTGSDSGWAVGAYEGAYNCEPLYRASEQCRMRSTGHDSFCPICTEALVQRLHRYVDPVETLGLAVVDGLWTVSASGPADTTLSVTVDDETVGIGTVADPPRWDPLAWTGEVLVVTAQASAGEVRGDRRDLQEQFRFSLSPE